MIDKSNLNEELTVGVCRFESLGRKLLECECGTW